MPPKPRIAHLAGSNATIQNSPPLVTSNKARAKYGLAAPERCRRRAVPLRRAPRPAAGGAGDGLRRAVQRASARARRRGALRPTRRLRRRDGRLSQGAARRRRPARVRDHARAGGRCLSPARTWRDRPTAGPGKKTARFRWRPKRRRGNPSIRTASRLFEEIDRLGVGDKGVGNLISATGRDRFLSGDAVIRLHEGARRGASDRRGRG